MLHNVVAVGIGEVIAWGLSYVGEIILDDLWSGRHPVSSV